MPFIKIEGQLCNLANVAIPQRPPDVIYVNDRCIVVVKGTRVFIDKEYGGPMLLKVGKETYTDLTIVDKLDPSTL